MKMLFSTTTSEGKLAISTKAQDEFTLHPSVSTKFIHKRNSLMYVLGMMDKNEKNKLQYGSIQIALKIN